MVVAVFFGGRSCEHDVSVITGLQAIKLLHGYDVVPVYIDREGKWMLPATLDPAAYRGRVKGRPLYLRPGDPYLYAGRGRRWKKADVALLCVHGAGGEDGCLQGILESSGVAYTGSGVGASAIGMDKRASKKMFAFAGLNVVEYTEAERAEYESGLLGIIARADEIGRDVIVKPASLGSSIGISLASDHRALIAALSVAFAWDNAVVIERALKDYIELNCAVYLDGEKTVVSKPERPLGRDAFLSFADKYERGAFGGGQTRQFPADISPELTDEVQKSARVAYEAVGASGIARVDFLYDGAEKKLYVNEINTVPGSLALYLFPDENEDMGAEKSAKSCAKFGSGSAKLLSVLLDAAIKEKRKREKPSYRYDGNVMRRK